MRALLLLPFAFSFAAAQLPPPNQAGVAMGHYHFRIRDVEAHRKLWVDVLGGKPSKLGRMESATLPGVIVLYEKGEPAAGTEGSVVHHIGFKVRDLKEALAKANAAGIKILSDRPSPEQAFLLASDDVRVELTEDRSMTTPSAHHHIHFYTASVEDTRAWYVKTFGAVPGRRGKFEAADVPGANLSFSPSKTPPAGTKGRALDHIGFEIRGLEAFAKKLEAAGVKFDVPYRKIPSLGIAIAFFTDPWGAYIELTEGLDRGAAQ